MENFPVIWGPRQRRTSDERRPLQATTYVTGHCHDAEKCNAETFCDCPCRTCMGTKRGEYSSR